MKLFSERFYRAMEAKEQWREEQRRLPFEEKLRLLDAFLAEEGIFKDPRKEGQEEEEGRDAVGSSG